MERDYLFRWLEALPVPHNIKPSRHEAVRFKRLVGTDAFERAIYFYRTQRSIEDAGVYNPYEPFALTFEVFQPYSGDSLSDTIGLSYPNNGLPGKLLAAGYSVLARDLYFAHHEPDMFSLLAPKFAKARQDIVVDPYYGVAPILLDGQPRLFHFVRCQWEQLLYGLRENFPDDPTPPIDDQLAQGLTFGQTGIGDCLGERIGDAYREGHIPDVIVENRRELEMLFSALKKIEGRGVELWFRGQNRDYQLPGRNELVRMRLAPIRSQLDFSLVPNAYRNFDRYASQLNDYHRFVREIGEWLNAAERVLGPTHRLRLPGEYPSKEPFPGVPDMRPSTSWTITHEDGTEESFVHDFFPSGEQLRKGLLLQHYGYPSPWLDITRDPEIALWFAETSCTVRPSGQYQFASSAWEQSLPAMPVIYVFALMKNHHPYLNSGELLLGAKATRVIRQKCGILGGAGNLARNYAARFVAMKIRLAKPIFTKAGLSQGYLFPGEEDDPVLHSLRRRERLSTESPIFPVTWA